MTDESTTPTGDFQWEDPQPYRRVSSSSGLDWPTILAPLRERPGEWAMIGHYNPGVSTHIKKGAYLGIDAGDYEVTTRQLPVGHPDRPKKVKIYVRYVGGGDD